MVWTTLLGELRKYESNLPFGSRNHLCSCYSVDADLCCLEKKQLQRYYVFCPSTFPKIRATQVLGLVEPHVPSDAGGNITLL